MSDFKSKLPDLKEISSIATKLYHDVKASVTEIIEEYKQKRADAEAEVADTAKKAEEEKAAAEKHKPSAAKFHKEE